MSGYLEDTGDWPFRESTPLRPPPEPEPEPEREPEAAAPVVAEPEPEPEQRAAEDEDPAGELALEELEPQQAEPEPEQEPEQAAPEPEQEPEQAAPEPEQEPEEEPAAAGLYEQVEEEPEAEVEPEVEHAEGELDIPAGYALLEGVPTGERRTVGIVVGRFNGEITNRLLQSALAELDEAGVAQDAITVMPVPGAFELPLAAMALAKTRRYACVVALGCVIRGETPHFDFVAGEAASGLQLAAVETGVPVAFGLLTCETREQAEERVDKGAEVVRAALEMADLFSQLRAQAAGQR
jgi:6,7-dimethyl-8-ribityllumazine synthase